MAGIERLDHRPGLASGDAPRRAGAVGRLARPAALAAGALWLAGFAAAQAVDRSAEMRPLGDCAGCVVEGQDLADRKLMGIDLGGAQLSGVRFDRAALGLAIFEGARLSGVSFDGAGLRGASFVGARLVDVTFAGADLRGAVFEGAVLERTDLQPAALCNTQMPDDAMDNSDCN